MFITKLHLFGNNFSAKFMKFVKLSVLISAKGQQAIDNSNKKLEGWGYITSVFRRWLTDGETDGQAAVSTTSYTALSNVLRGKNILKKITARCLALSILALVSAVCVVGQRCHCCYFLPFLYQCNFLLCQEASKANSLFHTFYSFSTI